MCVDHLGLCIYEPCFHFLCACRCIVGGVRIRRIFIHIINSTALSYGRAQVDVYLSSLCFLEDPRRVDPHTSASGIDHGAIACQYVAFYRLARVAVVGVDDVEPRVEK